MLCFLCLLMASLCFGGSDLLAQNSTNGAVPLVSAYSHNDYLQKRPLLDALDQGFCGVEADIFLVAGDLLVAHNRKDVKPNLSLRTAYLEPLAERVRRRIGIFAYPNTRLLLLIDVKEQGQATYEVLRQQLRPYSDILTHYGISGVVTGAVTVVISGDRAVNRIAADTDRLCAVDGRVEQLRDGSSSVLYPLISDSWPTLFQWRGNGSMPISELGRLRELVATAHKQGRKLRFWGGPDQPAVWKLLKEEGVDSLNTDNLAGLGAFLRGNPVPIRRIEEESQ